MPAPRALILLTTLTLTLTLTACGPEYGDPQQPEAPQSFGKQDVGFSLSGTMKAALPPPRSPWRTRNVYVPRISWGQTSLKGGTRYRIWTDGCNGTADEDTFLVLLDKNNKVVAANDNGGSAGCSRLRYRPIRSGTFFWEVWRKATRFDPTRPRPGGRVNVKLKVDNPIKLAFLNYSSKYSGKSISTSSAASSSTTKTLGLNVRVDGSAVGGFAMHYGTKIAAVRPSRVSSGSLHPRLMLLTTSGGPVEDYDVDGGGQYCPTCAVVRARYRSIHTSSVTSGVVMVGARSVKGYVDLRFGGKTLRATLPLTGASIFNRTFGPKLLRGVGSFVVQLSYATRVAMGDPVGTKTTKHTFDRYSGSSAADVMLYALLDKCVDSSCSSHTVVARTKRYRGHFGAADTTAPIYLQSHRGSGYYRVRVLHYRPPGEVYRTAYPKVWNNATTSHVTTLGSWNLLYAKEPYIDCKKWTAPVAQVWTRYRNEVDLMTFQEVDYQCHFKVLRDKSRMQDSKRWEFYYTRGDTYTANCDDDHVGFLLNQRVWPNLQAASWDHAGRGRGKEHGKYTVNWYDHVEGKHRDVHCWNDGGWSMLCNGKKGRPEYDNIIFNNRENDPIYPEHGMGCRMSTDYSGFNRYTHAITSWIRPLDGPGNGAGFNPQKDIVVVTTHQHANAANDTARAHKKTYLEKLPTLVYGLYPGAKRIIYLGDLNMNEDAHEWEAAARILRKKFKYVIDTRLITSGVPIATKAGRGSSCTDTYTDRNDAALLLGEGWKALDPAASVSVEDWSSAGKRRGKIEYRASRKVSLQHSAYYWEHADCVPACNGTPEQGCVNYGDPVLKTDHMLLINKIRTAFP